MTDRNNITSSTGGGGPSSSSDASKEAAEEIRTIKTRVQRLEEARAAEPPEGTFAGRGKIIPIERVPDRADVDDVVSKNVKFQPSADVIDDFEDADMSEYSGDTSSTSIRNYPVQNGQKSLSITLNTGAEQNVVSNSGLNYYPKDGDVYRYWTYISDDNVRSLHYFGAADLDNAYRVDVSEDADELSVSKLDTGSLNTLATASTSVGTSVWYQVEVDWTGTGFTVTLFDDSGNSLASVSDADDEYTSGGVGWGVTPEGTQLTDDEVIFDFARTVTSAAVIDDFEDSNITEYNGDTGSASTDNRSNIPTEHGDFALKITGTATIQAPAGNLNNDASPGNTFKTQHYVTSGSISRHLFGVQDASNHYFVEADSVNGDVRLAKVDGGTTSTITEDTSASVPTDEWSQFEIEWKSSGTIEVDYFDSAGNTVSSISGSDSTFTSGGHGWSEQGSSVTSYFDYARTVNPGYQTRKNVIDSFEDDDLSEYTGNTGNVTIQTSTVENGKRAAEIPAGGNQIFSTSGLQNYPSQSDFFEYYQYLADGAKASFYFGVQDSSNYYEIVLDSANDNLTFNVISGGSNQSFSVTSVTIETGAWVRVAVEWLSSGDFKIEYFDSSDTKQAELTPSDTTYTSGGVGWGEKS